MAIETVHANRTLRKRSARSHSASLQFEELCSLLNHQYVSLQVVTPIGVKLLIGKDLDKALKTARVRKLRDTSGRQTGTLSSYYVITF